MGNMSRLSQETPPRDQYLRELQSSQAQVVRLLESMADVQDWQPEPAEWSFRLIAAHLATVEQACHFHRVVAIASGGTPGIDLYTNRAIPPAPADLQESLQKWIAMRRRLIAFVAALAEPQMAYVGIHPVVGPVTLLEVLQDILDQDQGNLRHVYQLITAYYEEALVPHRV